MSEDLRHRPEGPAAEPAPPLRHIVRSRGQWWLALLVLAVVEVAGHVVIQARVPAQDDWEAAAAHLREGFEDGDAVGVAPGWADPLLRRYAGDVITIRQAGRSDLAPYERLWTLSIRGHRPPEVDEVPVAATERFGRVTVRRYDLGPSPVLYDFVQNVRQAEVRLGGPETGRPCPWRRRRFGRGGLGAGAMTPASRFVCDPRRGWLWVGRTVIEDLELQGRTCIWQHPEGERPVRVTFRDVPLGDRLVLYGGLYSENEREQKGGPVHVRLAVDGTEIGRMTHRDGDGWKRMVALTGSAPELEGLRRGDVSVEVTAPRPHHRSFCWSATTRRGEREGPR